MSDLSEVSSTENETDDEKSKHPDEIKHAYSQDDGPQSSVSHSSKLTAQTSCELKANTFVHSKRTKIKNLDMGTQSRIKYSVSSVTWKDHKFPNDDTFSNMIRGEKPHKNFDEVLRLYLNSDNREMTFDMKIAHWVEISGPMVEEVKRLRNERNNTVKKKLQKARCHVIICCMVL